jgi:tRNA nucleotidyltransferase/poly(A) polymerase/tetratricopeptide (TPR) repeat protein
MSNEDLLNYYAQLLKLNPYDTDVYMKRAMVYKKLGTEYTEKFQHDLDLAIRYRKEESQFRKEYYVRLRCELTTKNILDEKISLLLTAKNDNSDLTNDSVTPAFLGHKFLRDKKYASAINYFKQAIERFEHDFISLVKLSNVYFQTHEMQLAYKYLNIAIDKYPHAEAYLARGLCYHFTNEPELAKADLLTSIKIGTKEELIALHCILDFLLRSINGPPIENINLATETAIGRRKIDKGKFEAALVSFSKVVASYPYPHPSNLYAERGSVHILNKNFESALLDFSLAILIAEKNKESVNLEIYYSKRRKLHVELDNLDAAWSDHKNAVLHGLDNFKKLEQDFGIECWKKGRNELTNENHEKALHLFRISQQMTPAFAQLYIDIGILHRQMGEIEAAIAAFAVAIGLEPKNYLAFSHIRAMQKLWIKNLTTNTDTTTSETKIISNELIEKEEKKKSKKPKSPAVNHLKKIFSPNNHKPNKSSFKTPLPEETIDLTDTLLSLPLSIINNKKEKEEQDDKRRENAKIKAKRKADKKRARLQSYKNKSVCTSEVTGEEDNIPSSVSPQPSPKTPLQTYSLWANSSSTVSQYKVAITPAEVEYLTRLKQASYAAEIVGGAVRDRLDICPNMRSIKLNDIDITTAAPPEEIQRIFSDKDLYPVIFIPGLFKVYLEDGTTIDIKYNSGMTESRIIDAASRDFTCNALYLDEFGHISDPTQRGISDLKSGYLQTIEEPAVAFVKNPILILRAIYFSTKCSLKIPEIMATEIKDKAPLLLEKLPLGQINCYLKKLFSQGMATENLRKLQEYGLLANLFPTIDKELLDPWLKEEMKLTDQHKRVSLLYIYLSFIISASQQQIHLTQYSIGDIIKKSLLIDETFKGQKNISHLMVEALNRRKQYYQHNEQNSSAQKMMCR